MPISFRNLPKQLGLASEEVYMTFRVYWVGEHYAYQYMMPYKKMDRVRAKMEWATRSG